MHKRVVLFLFHQNEIELISDWLQYHTYMFGISNIVVVDNMSANAGVCKLLALYQQCGLLVVEYAGKFSTKAVLLSKIMRNTSAELLIPLDTDEFVVSLLNKTEDDEEANFNFNSTEMA